MGNEHLLGIENALFTAAMLLYFASMIGYIAYIAFKKEILAKIFYIVMIVKKVYVRLV